MKTVLITGISRGIGKALAQKFLAEGHAVIGTHQGEALDYSNENLKALELELTSTESIRACADTILESGAKIDILINNAGVMEDNDETHVIINNLRKTLEVNLIGTIDWTEKLLAVMNMEGHIINISSAAGSLTDEEYADKPGDFHHNSMYKTTRSATNPYLYPSYKISKCALNMYTCILAELMKRDRNGIIVSSVTPGWTRTKIGGDEAPTTPEEAANDIFKLAVSRPETGQFWYKGEKYPW